jgi:FMN phosphatase YigB (HAD superfamily)
VADVLARVAAQGPRCTIAWDVDDVLNDLTRVWFDRVWRPAHPESTVRYEQLTANPPHECLGTTRQEFLRSLDAFRLAYFDALEPSAAVLAWLARHGADCRHVAFTAAPRRVAPLSAAWVLRHFGDWIRVFAFVPSPRDDDRLPRAGGKGEALEWLTGIDVLVDDSPVNVAAARAAGRAAVLVPRPWNSARGTVEDALSELLHIVGRRPAPSARAGARA